jgi:hypothetical protein
MFRHVELTQSKLQVTWPSLGSCRRAVKTFRTTFLQSHNTSHPGQCRVRALLNLCRAKLKILVTVHPRGLHSATPDTISSRVIPRTMHVQFASVLVRRHSVLECSGLARPHCELGLFSCLCYTMIRSQYRHTTRHSLQFKSYPFIVFATRWHHRLFEILDHRPGQSGDASSSKVD